MTQPSPIRAVVEQHAEELAALWTTRQAVVDAGHVALRHLARIDERIAAHQDGCAVAGGAALRVLNAQLATVTPGRVFAASVVALELNDRPTMARCLSLVEAIPEARCGMISALGWVSPDRLRGVVKEIIEAPSAALRSVGLAACRVHGVSPGAALLSALDAEDPGLRAEACRAAAVLGDTGLTSTLAATVDPDPACQFWSAWAAVLLGDRKHALGRLTHLASTEGVHRLQAFVLSCQAMAVASAHQMLSSLAGDPAQKRYLIEGAGIVGDPLYIPWLIAQMADDKTARAAGEAFSAVTGADLALLDLERKPPEDTDRGPNDDPDDSRVAMEADEGMPWPDQARVRLWWQSNESRFPKGGRYLSGEPLAMAGCLQVLRSGTQRRRGRAAQQISLLEPGRRLFNTAAPASRQQEALAKI